MKKMKKNICKCCGCAKDNYGDNYGDYCYCCKSFFKDNGSFEGALEFKKEVEIQKEIIRIELDIR